MKNNVFEYFFMCKMFFNSIVVLYIFNVFKLLLLFIVFKYIWQVFKLFGIIGSNLFPIFKYRYFILKSQLKYYLFCLALLFTMAFYPKLLLLSVWRTYGHELFSQLLFNIYFSFTLKRHWKHFESFSSGYVLEVGAVAHTAIFCKVCQHTFTTISKQFL